MIITNLIYQALQQAWSSLFKEVPPVFSVEGCKYAAQGDYASNIALVAAKLLNQAPIKIAEQLVAALAAAQPQQIAEIIIAKPGFINFRVSDQFLHDGVQQVLNSGFDYGKGDSKNTRILVEFVSANPTGPLHVGHGRGAAVGDSLVRILKFYGHDASAEYYINDAGRQIDILLLSVLLRALQQKFDTVQFPANAYHGEYVAQMVSDFVIQFAQPVATIVPCDLLLQSVAAKDDPQAEQQLSALLDWLNSAFVMSDKQHMAAWVADYILQSIKTDLANFGVVMDNWFSEASLLHTQTNGSNSVQDVIANLLMRKNAYHQDDAVWFRATDFDDDKDRVLVRSNGQYTYFATDVAYHQNKYKRDFDRLINIWGADHHGYVQRLRCSQQALGHDAKALHCELIQFVALVRKGEKVSMSTRSGQFITLAQLLKEVGTDACRFYFVKSKANQHIDFDLDLAVAESKDNPVFLCAVRSCADLFITKSIATD